MADQWYYTEQEQRRGPVSEEQLKELASTGQLKPTDKVWKKGMASWGPAAGLFAPSVSEEPPPILPDNEPPPIPQERKGTTAKAKEMAASFFQQGKDAMSVLAKQAERTKLVNITLPLAYPALGRHIHKSDYRREEFTRMFQRVDGLLADIAALNTPSLEKDNTSGLAAKVKAAAKSAREVAQTQLLKLKLNRSFSELGKLVFEKYGNECGPEELVRPILAATKRLTNLESEIGHSSQSRSGQFLTPTRIAMGGLCVVLAVALIAGVIPFRGSRGPDSAKAVLRDSAKAVLRDSANAVLKELRKLHSYTEAGLTYQEYQRRVLDAKGEIDSQLSQMPSGPLKDSLSECLDAYVDANEFWGKAIQGSSSDYPEGTFYLESEYYARYAKYGDVHSQRFPDLARKDAVQLLWKRASEKIKVAEDLLTVA